jgi:uncharacterized membrane protein
MGAVFVVIAVIAGLWSAVKYQAVYNTVVDTLPPQFQDGTTSRFAVPVYALMSSTPLPLQGEYMKSGIGGCVMFLSASLSLFAFHQPILGFFGLCVTAVCIYTGIESWRTYRENCKRAGKIPFDTE